MLSLEFRFHGAKCHPKLLWRKFFPLAGDLGTGPQESVIASSLGRRLLSMGHRADPPSPLATGVAVPPISAGGGPSRTKSRARVRFMASAV